MPNRDYGRFSQRYGFSDHDGDGLIRDDAPESLRCGLLEIGQKMGLQPSQLRRMVCGALRVRPDPSNWSEYPNVWQEVEGLIHSCAWNRVYDTIEAVYAALPRTQAEAFEAHINALFAEEGIGWQLSDGAIEIRGDEAFETVVTGGKEAVEKAGMTVASTELHEAIRDLSRRPEPDLSGAVQHAMAALECAVRGVSGEPRPTLGELVKKYPDLFPKPVDEAVAKLWGYASEQARHGRESRDLAWEEAQLAVGVAAVLCSYLTSKVRQ